MVAMLGKILRCLRLHAVLLLITTLVFLRNAVQCGRLWQGCGRCGSAVVAVGGGNISSHNILIATLYHA